MKVICSHCTRQQTTQHHWRTQRGPEDMPPNIWQFFLNLFGIKTDFRTNWRTPQVAQRCSSSQRLPLWPSGGLGPLDPAGALEIKKKGRGERYGGIGRVRWEGTKEKVSRPNRTPVIGSRSTFTVGLWPQTLALVRQRRTETREATTTTLVEWNEVTENRNGSNFRF